MTEHDKQDGKDREPKDSGVGRGAAGQPVQRRELLKRGLSLGMGVLFVGSAWAAGTGGAGGKGRKDSVCISYDPDGNLVIDTLCGTLTQQANVVEDSSCAKPLHQGAWSGPLSQDYDCGLTTSDQSCGKPAGVGTSGPTSYWSDLGCGLGDGQDLDCGLESWTGDEFRDNGTHGNG